MFLKKRKRLRAVRVFSAPCIAVIKSFYRVKFPEISVRTPSFSDFRSRGGRSFSNAKESIFIRRQIQNCGRKMKVKAEFR